MVKKSRSEFKKKDVNMNIKFPAKEYEELKDVADKLGMTMSSLVRSIIFQKLDKVRSSGNPQDFFKG